MRYGCLAFWGAPFHGGFEGLLFYLLRCFHFRPVKGTARKITIGFD